MVFEEKHKALFLGLFHSGNYHMIRTNENSIPTVGSTKSPANIELAGFIIFQDGTLDGTKENFSVVRMELFSVFVCFSCRLCSLTPQAVHFHF